MHDIASAEAAGRRIVFEGAHDPRDPVRMRGGVDFYERFP